MESLDPKAASAPLDKKKILHERARLFRKRPDKKEAEERTEVLEFFLSGERYGLETIFIREVYPLKEYTPLPCTPAYVFGLINVRGRILAIVDMRKFFELPEKGLSDLNQVVIIQNAEMEFGILAEEIIGVRTFLREELYQSLPTLTDIREKYLLGVTKEQAVILDAAKLLRDSSLIVHEEI